MEAAGDFGGRGCFEKQRQASIKLTRASSIETPWLATSSSGHNATKPSSSRSIIAVKRCAAFMIRVYTSSNDRRVAYAETGQRAVPEELLPAGCVVFDTGTPPGPETGDSANGTDGGISRGSSSPEFGQSAVFDLGSCSKREHEKRAPDERSRSCLPGPSCSLEI